MRTFALLLLALSAAPALAQGLIIVDASYGADGRYCDAGYALAERCEGRFACRVDAGNHLCGDPRRGRVKALEIRYACPGEHRDRLLRLNEGESIELRCAGRGRSARDEVLYGRGGRHDGGIYIEAATYVAGRKYCDATSAVASACDGTGRCAVEVGNRLCGDPFEGKRKQLEVRWSCGGHSRRAVFAENQLARLDCR